MKTLRVLPVLVLAMAFADVAPPAHEVPARTGHPRLFFTAAELPALRQKMTVSGSFAKKCFEDLKATTGRPSRYSLGYVRNPDPPASYQAEVDPGYATPAILAAIDPDPNERYLWGCYAVEVSLALIRNFDPPYSNAPEWRGRRMNRWVALTYDCCQDVMSTSEIGEFREEMQKICSITRFQVGPANHNVAYNSGLGAAGQGASRCFGR